MAKPAGPGYADGMNRLMFLGLGVLHFFIWSPAPARAAEPWADGALTVTDGLELWLDATHENAAREARELPPLVNGAPLDYWHDGSGRGRHCDQRQREARPQWRALGGGAFARFDGQNDFLAAAIAPRVTMAGATVFVFAAPASNPGLFCGLLAWNARGKNDYQSGFNVDLGGGPSTNWNRVNVEGPGATGEKNLLREPVAFGAFHTVAITMEPGPQGTRLHFDGVAQGARARKESTLVMDELSVGARHYENNGGAPAAASFFAGDIAEVLVYGRALADGERGRVEAYLAKKYAGLVRAVSDPTAPAEKPLVAVTNPPPVQMLVPGFTVRELPLQLNNINNLVCAPDGRLFALAYDGNVFQLKDTDGDGLEDLATHFFKNDRNEIPSTIGMAWGPGGLYIPCKGRVIRLRDRGDGTGELETRASGWVAPAALGGASLDAIGIAVDGSGNVFFGLGCDSWSAAYRVDKATGKSAYDIQSERGTILKLPAGGGSREIVCTGMRWPVSLAFNAAGDLFGTDQEGATWLPNGNPLDELIHIQPGRHYGFPPRHPQHLPGVIDEPNVFDYAPQHQSTCGLHFNEPVGGSGKSFGPAWWRGDALVAGESRGKIYRTKLVKTAAGYVAQNNLIACLNMLTLDAAPTPQGDLIVACHSGQPDWGTGPQGKGKLYKISLADPAAPQPVLAYATSPTETRIVFDRPLDPAQLKNLARQSSVTSGKYVAAGDRFEVICPGYQVVQNQMLAPRFELRVFSAGVGADARSLVLQTAPRIEAVNYAVTLPDAARAARSREESRRELPQHAAMDLLTDLTGVEVSWRDAAGRTNWSGWLPHLDLTAARAFTAASEEHTRLFESLKTPGTLTLRAQLDLWQMLRAATQPGSKLDFEYPPETVTVVFKSGGTLDAKAGAPATVGRVSRREWRVTIEPKSGQWLPLELSFSTGEGEPTLDVSWHTAEDPRPRALPLRRILLPWATPKVADAPGNAERRIPEIAGGDWQRGRSIFFGEPAACSKCHQVGGEGGKIGPDLSNLVHRDYASVLKDITQPSAALNPDHLAYEIELKDGDAISGVIVDGTSEAVVVGQVTGANLTVARSRIAGMKAASLSLMPEGLLQGLDARAQKDLLTFLLGPVPKAKP